MLPPSYTVSVPPFDKTMWSLQTPNSWARALLIKNENMDSQLLKIATLNLCLGLKYKKDLVKNYLYSEEIDILAVQETEIEKDFNCDLLSIKGFKYEYEENSFKKRVGFYIKNCIKYERKRELEVTYSHLIVIDVDKNVHFTD